MYCWPFEINLQGALSCKCKVPCVSAESRKQMDSRKDCGRLCPGCLWQVSSDILFLLQATRASPENKAGIALSVLLFKIISRMFITIPLQSDGFSMDDTLNFRHQKQFSHSFSLGSSTVIKTIGDEIKTVFILCALGANPVKTSGSDFKAPPLSSANHRSHDS